MKIVIISTSYNCEKYIQNCIDSVLIQNFKNYFWTIIDDNSNDNTVKIIKKNIKNKNNIKLLINLTRSDKISNIYKAINKTKIEPNDIIVSLDADDELYSKNTLSQIYLEYKQNKDLLLTFGKYISKPLKIKCFLNQEIIKNSLFNNNIIRKNDQDKIFYRSKKFFYYSHLKTFKYKLFTKIKKEDLINKFTNSFYKSSTDVAIMIPMLEMCGYGRVKNITYPTYIYKTNNLFSFHNQNRKKQRANFDLIMQQKPRDIIFPSNHNSIMWGKLYDNKL